MILLASNKNKGLPLPLGRGVCETKSKNGHSRPRKPFISRVFCAQRGIETMVSDHGLGNFRKGPDHGVGVDPETVNNACRDSMAKLVRAPDMLQNSVSHRYNCK